MPSKKAIKQRVASVGTIKQIVKAMDMVAATKLQRTRARLEAARPLFDEVKGIMGALKTHEETVGNVFFQEPQGRRAAYAVITADRGLCGSYNMNVAAAALEHMESSRKETIIAIGLRGREYFGRRNKQILHCYQDVSDTMFYEDARKIGNTLIELYTDKQVDEVYVVYTHYASVLHHEPRLLRVLPVEGAQRVSALPTSPAVIARRETIKQSAKFGIKFEPDFDTFLERAMPKYIGSILYGALLESGACEQAARMLSMEAATKNAETIIDDLTRTYNRKRQAEITQEIAEVVGGANIN